MSGTSRRAQTGRTSSRPPRLPRSRWSSVVLAVAVAVTALVGPESPVQAAGTDLLQDTFADGTVTSTGYVVGGTGFTPCLTSAGTGTSVPGRCATAFDSAGAGALRLTSAGNNQAGYLLYNEALPTKAGLDITFDQYQYGGSGADGISFFLTDGSKELTRSGPTGGALGYNRNTTTRGLPHALIGVGLDAYGNFATQNSAECPTSAIQTPDAVSVRGPAGDVTDSAGSSTGYCLLGAPVAIAGGIDNTATTTRGAARHKVRIVVDPPANASPKIRVYWDQVADTDTPRVVVNQPAVLASTPTFKFGWAASTGGATNIHEINYLTVRSVDEIFPELQLTPGVTELVADADQQAVIPLTTTVQAQGGPESQPITVTATIPAGLSFAGTPTSTDPVWVCATPATGATSTTCTYTPTSPLNPGTVLAPVNVAVTTAGSGTGTLSATVSSSDNVGTRSSIEPVDITFRPTVEALTGSGTATSPGTPVVMGPGTTVGTAPFTYEIVPGSLDPDRGTATVDADGEVVFTPIAGESGRTTFDYRATDTTNGIEGPASSVTATVRPAATTDFDVDTDFGVAETVDLSAGVVGTGPFTYTVVSQPAEAGSVTVSGSVATFTPAVGYSGSDSFTYTVTGRDSVTSQTRTGPVTVAPSTTNATASFSLDAIGEGAGNTSTPTPAGTGPFTYALVPSSEPILGTAVIDASTGAVTYTAASRASGTFTTEYTVTDADGITSPAQTATITVMPYVGNTTGETVVDEPVTLADPVYAGTPATWSLLTDPGRGTATIDPDTGAVTYTPTAGTSGSDLFLVVATDASGVSSLPATVAATVRPTVASSTQTLPYSADTQLTTFNPAPSGTGPWTYTILDGPAPEKGTASFDSSGVLTVESAAGRSGTMVVRYTATGAGDVSSAPATATLVVQPATDDLAASTTLAADGSATASTSVPTPSGTGPYTYRLLDGSGPAAGSAVIDPATGVVTYTAATGVSGVFDVQYQALDADGVASPARNVTVTVRPYVSPLSGRTTVGQPVTLPAADSVGTDLTWSVSQPGSGATVVDAATGVVTYTPPAGWSGTDTFTLQATDADGVSSAPQTVGVLVSPVAEDTPPVRTTASEDGSSVTVRLAPPAGTGPFTFALADALDPALGTASIDTSTGEIVFTPAGGTSGTVTLRYTVADVSGGTSDGTVDVIVEPSAEGPSGQATSRRTTAGQPVTFQLPEPFGTGPFGYELTEGPPASEGTVTIDAVTGEVTFVPASGFTGTATFSYTVTDAAGATSAPVEFQVNVDAASVNGPAGPTGPSGASGPSGPTGAAGAVGAAGDDGAGGWVQASSPASLARTGVDLVVLLGLALGLFLSGALVLRSAPPKRS